MKIAYYLFLAANKIVAVVPVKLTRTLARFGALVYLYAFPAKRHIVERNMRRAMGPEASHAEVRRMARRAGRYYADYWVDILWLPTKTRDYVLGRFGKDGQEMLEATIAEGKGVIIALPHYGSWEAGAVYLSSLGKFAAVAEVLKPIELFELFCKLRAGVGIDIFPYNHKPETRDSMIDKLKEGMILALLCDRDLKGGGVEVEFFGEKTTLPPGPAVMSMKSGSPIICVNVRNLSDDTWMGHALDPIRIEEDVDSEAAIRRAMQKVASNLEILIREDPGQWHMFMPAWPSDREAD
jgi:phosphatidylinositol dimannoside acyltransferase